MKRSFIVILFSLRWPNLLITLATLCVSYFILLIPINTLEGLELNLSLPDFTLLTISTLLIMSGGYIINDLMDVESDAINEKGDGIAKKDGFVFLNGSEF